MAQTEEQRRQQQQQCIGRIKALYDEYAKTSKDAAGLLVVAHVVTELNEKLRPLDVLHKIETALTRASGK